MKLLFATFVALVAGSGVTTTAQAHFLYHHKHMTLAQKISYFKRSVSHDQRAIIWLKNVRHQLHAKRQLESESQWHSAVRVRQAMKWHQAAKRWHTAQLQRFQEKWRARHPRHTLSGSIPHLSAWLCIHRYEGSWTDGGSPYWGGLQMDLSFMSSYGGSLLKSKGTADNWTPTEQMLVAENAYRSRGFSPWPNTARYCGLI
jgi:Transglycosylase-like domain